VTNRLRFAIAVLTGALSLGAAHMSWPAGWSAFSVAIRGASMAAYGPLGPAVVAPGGGVYFEYHGTLYRIDPARRAFRRDRDVPRGCMPVFDAATNAWCADHDDVVRVSATGARTRFRSVFGSPRALQRSGDAIWFVIPGRMMYGRLERGRFSVERFRGSEPPRFVVLDGPRVWIATRRTIVRVSDGASWTVVPAASSDGIRFFAARGGVLYAVVASNGPPRIVVIKDNAVHAYALSFPELSDAAIDSAGTLWIAERRPRGFGAPGSTDLQSDVVLAAVRHGQLREFRVPLIGADAVAADRTGHLWITAGDLHAFSVIAPSLPGP
jgi:hypothetical protein